MIVLAGLGNPGEKYSRHRHNVGFMAVDAIADAHGFSAPREKFHGQCREGFLDTRTGRQKAIVLKPLTHMNDSGRSLRAAADFYKLSADDFVVFYDELDLAPGKLRVKTGGGAAGHNGIRSIDSHLGNAFRRVRIGIGHPGDKSKVTNHVLGNFSKADREWLDPVLDAITKAAPFLAEDEDQRFAADVAQRIAPARKEQAPKPAPKTPEQTTERKTAEPNDDADGNPFTEAFRKLLGR